MFHPNLGRSERTIRLVLGVALAAWIYRRPHHGALEFIVSVAALFLVLNALLSRCYLWRLLGINTCRIRRHDIR